MKVRKVLELSIDLSDLYRESTFAIRAILETLPTVEGQVALLHMLKQDIDTLLKGVEPNAEQVHEPSRIEKDK